MHVEHMPSKRLARCVALMAVLFGAWLASPGAAPATAASEPFKIDFDKSNVQIGLLPDLPLDTIASGASLEGTIDEAGNVTVPKGNFKLPELGLDEPVKVRGFMGIESATTGTFDRATGRLELDAKAGIWVSVDAAALLDLAGVDIGDLIGGGSGLGNMVKPLLNDLTCGFSPMDVHFTTESNSLSSGARFKDGPTGTGAITAEWRKLGPFSSRTKLLGFIDPCQMLLQYLPGLLGGSLPGGADLGGVDTALLIAGLNNLDLGPSAITLTRTKVDPGTNPQTDRPTDPPTDSPAGKAKLRLSVTPKKLRVRAGKATTFRVKVRNIGKSKAKKVRVCLTGPGVGVLARWRCGAFGSIRAGGSKVRRFRVKVKQSSPRRVANFHFRVRSANAAKRMTSTRLLVPR